MIQIRRISVQAIKAAAYNPRVDLQPGDDDYEKLKRSLDEFGCVEPLVWNERSGNLVGGHQRFKVLIASGANDVEVSVVDLSPEKEKALNIALNKIQGDWDKPRLTALLEELSALPDFDVSLTGFDDVEIGQLLDRFGNVSSGEDGFDLADALDAAADRPVVTQAGELIELGSHRLLCGDSAKPEDVQRLLESVRIHVVDLVFTDPPYNVAYYGGNRPTPQKARPKPSRQWKAIYYDNLTQEEYESWLAGILKNMLAPLATGARFFSWNGHRQFGQMHTMLSSLNAHMSCVITWAKECFAIGYGDYNQQTEFCLYGWKKEGEAHRWYGPTNESTLWQISRDCTKEYRHPTQKPLALAERAIKNSSKRGDVVLDLFGGSGTTLISAHRLERHCLIIEIDPHYCDAIVRRYLALVGDDPSVEHLRQRYLQTAESVA